MRLSIVGVSRPTRNCPTNESSTVLAKLPIDDSGPQPEKSRLSWKLLIRSRWTSSSPVAGSMPNAMSALPFRFGEDTPSVHENPTPTICPSIGMVDEMVVEMSRCRVCWFVTVGVRLFSATFTLQPLLQPLFVPVQ